MHISRSYCQAVAAQTINIIIISLVLSPIMSIEICRCGSLRKESSGKKKMRCVQTISTYCSPLAAANSRIINAFDIDRLRPLSSSCTDATHAVPLARPSFISRRSFYFAGRGGGGGAVGSFYLNDQNRAEISASIGGESRTRHSARLSGRLRTCSPPCHQETIMPGYTGGNCGWSITVPSSVHASTQKRHYR